MSTVGDVQYRGGYHDARGGYHEYIYHDIPYGTEHPPRYSRYPPTVLKRSPHGTEHPSRYCTHIIQGGLVRQLLHKTFGKLIGKLQK